MHKAEDLAKCPIIYSRHIHFGMPHGEHMTTMCAYPSSNYPLPHWKYVLCCCARCTQIDILSPESDQHNSNVIPTIRFHVYKTIACCTANGILPLN